MKNLMKTKRLSCECAKPPKGFEQFTDKRGVYIMTHPIHELHCTTWHPKVQYKCTNCGDIKHLEFEE